MKRINIWAASLSFAVAGALNIGAPGIASTTDTQTVEPLADLIAQSATPVTYITRLGWDPDQLVIQISEGEFIFHGYLFRTTGSMFVGEDDQVRIMYDEETERVVVINVQTGTEFYNYFFHEVDSTVDEGAL